MGSKAYTFQMVPDELEKLLLAHLPHSLPLLRRLQFAKYRGNATAHSRYIIISDVGGFGNEIDKPNKFTAAYVDYSGGPETQMWLFSTLEKEVAEDMEVQEYRRQLAELVREVNHLGKEYGKPTTLPEGLVLGSLSTSVRRILDDMGRLRPRGTGFYDKWLFRTEELPTEDFVLSNGMVWDMATLSDCKIVVARTDIQRRPEKILPLPNLLIRTEDKTPIAWAFLGYDGSLISLHCEEAYRRKGLAKALAAKLMRRGPGEFVKDGWCFADVAANNAGSRAMCRSLNGRPHWEVSWVMFDVTDEGANKRP